MFRAALRSRLVAVPSRPAAAPRTLAVQARFLATPVEPSNTLVPVDEAATLTPRSVTDEESEDLLGPMNAEEESGAIIKRFRGPGFPMIPVSSICSRDSDCSTPFGGVS